MSFRLRRSFAFTWRSMYRSPLDMRAEIDRSIVDGHFMESMNDYVVQSAIRFAYGASDEGRSVAERYLRRPSDPVVSRW